MIKAPSYDNIRTFGTLCFARKITRNRDKFDERGTRCLFLGYPMGKKGWLVFDLTTEKTFISRDVIFHEEKFPYIDSPPDIEREDQAVLTLTHPAIFDDETEQSQATPVESSSGGVTATTDPPTTAIPDSEPVAPNAETELGRGRRQKQTSVLLKPYVTYAAQVQDSHHAPQPTVSPLSSSSKSSYPLTNYVSFHRLSPVHQAYLTKVAAEHEPISYNEAMRDPRWNNAVIVEADALDKNHTWDVTDLPPRKVAIGCKWVFKIKYRADGTIERFKARLVVLGNRQQEGVDYKETFAPVVKMTTVRILLEISAAKGWELFQMDVHNAFLHGDLDDEVYMKLPPGFTASSPNKVCKLRKSLYGLRQAPRCWFAKLSTALKEFGFQQNYSDYSLFTLKKGSSIIYVLVYVDDLIIGGNDSTLITHFKEYLNRKFHMKDLGILKYFLGIEVSRNTEGIYLSQQKYALDIISECGLLGSKPIDTPMEQNQTRVLLGAC